MIWADLVRLFAGVTILAFASWTDWRWRRAPNVLWWILAAAGLVALAIDLAAEPSRATAGWGYLVAIPAFAALMYLFWWLGLIAGGADAKALMALALLLPWPLEFGALPLLRTVVPGSFAVLGNTLLAFLLVPLALFVANAARGAFRFPHAFLGFRVPLDRLGATPSWPMERVENGKVTTKLFASRAPEMPLEELREELGKAGLTHVWMTPKVPFMIPLLVGFALAFTAGDLLVGGMMRVLP